MVRANPLLGYRLPNAANARIDSAIVTSEPIDTTPVHASRASRANTSAFAASTSTADHRVRRRPLVRRVHITAIVVYQVVRYRSASQSTRPNRRTSFAVVPEVSSDCRYWARRRPLPVTLNISSNTSCVHRAHVRALICQQTITTNGGHQAHSSSTTNAPTPLSRSASTSQPPLIPVTNNQSRGARANASSRPETTGSSRWAIPYGSVPSWTVISDTATRYLAEIASAIGARRRS